MIVKIDIDNLCDVDTDTLSSLIKSLQDEKDKRREERRQAVIQIYHLLEDIDKLCKKNNLAMGHGWSKKRFKDITVDLWVNYAEDVED